MKFFSIKFIHCLLITIVIGLVNNVLFNIDGIFGYQWDGAYYGFLICAISVAFSIGFLTVCVKDMCRAEKFTIALFFLIIKLVSKCLFNMYVNK